MNTEELKMILEMLGRVSETAGGAVKWWMVMHYGEKVLTTLCATVGISGTIVYVARCMSNFALAEVEANKK